MGEEVPRAGTRSSPRPTAVISSMPSGRRARSASAPSSIATPATSDADSFPPSRGEPSSTVTRTGSSLRKKAADRPAIPPPITTTCAVASAVMIPSLYLAGSAPEADRAVLARGGEGAAVRAERHVVDLARVAEQGLVAAGRDFPDGPRAGFVAAGDERAVRAERNRVEDAVACPQDAGRLAGHHVVELHGAVGA